MRLYSLLFRGVVELDLQIEKIPNRWPPNKGFFVPSTKTVTGLNESKMVVKMRYL